MDNLTRHAADPQMLHWEEVQGLVVIRLKQDTAGVFPAASM